MKENIRNVPASVRFFTKQAKATEYERQTDQMAYKLYSLTEEEIRMAEGGAK